VKVPTSRQRFAPMARTSTCMKAAWSGPICMLPRGSRRVTARSRRCTAVSRTPTACT